MTAVTIHKVRANPGSSEFYVYHGEKLIRVCPSEAMAREIAAGLEQRAQEIGEDML